jgi:Ser/Thr protein kinase RdoA (MazF antagonist)
VGHLDLNPWNVIVSAGGAVFLDWAEAYVGPPFFSFEYLLQHFRREIGANAVLESELVNAYKAPWRQLLSDDLTSEALALTALAAVFAYAAGTNAWKDEEKLRDPKTRAYFRSLARRMKREAIQFIEQRSACLS